MLEDSIRVSHEVVAGAGGQLLIARLAVKKGPFRSPVAAEVFNSNRPVFHYPLRVGGIDLLDAQGTGLFLGPLDPLSHAAILAGFRTLS